MGFDFLKEQFTTTSVRQVTKDQLLSIKAEAEEMKRFFEQPSEIDELVSLTESIKNHLSQVNEGSATQWELRRWNELERSLKEKIAALHKKVRGMEVEGWSLGRVKEKNAQNLWFVYTDVRGRIRKKEFDRDEHYFEVSARNCRGINLSKTAIFAIQYQKRRDYAGGEHPAFFFFRASENASFVLASKWQGKLVKGVIKWAERENELQIGTPYYVYLVGRKKLEEEGKPKPKYNPKDKPRYAYAFTFRLLAKN